MKRENVVFKKRYLVILLFVALIVGITFGYAELRTTLSINGTTTISKVTWNVKFDRQAIKTGSYLNPDPDHDGAARNTIVLTDDDTTLTYNVTLAQPGDYFEFDVYIHNTGTLPAKLESITRGDDDTVIDTAMAKYLSYTETGFPEQGSVLAASGENKITIRVEYKDSVNPEELPGTPQTFKRTVHFNYVQNK